MKKYFLLLFILPFLGCEPSWRIEIQNNGPAELFIKTYPSIESFYDVKGQKALQYKVNQEAKYSVYKLNANSKMILFSHIGFQPELEEMPFEFIQIINGPDTLTLDTKEKILKQTKLIGKRTKGNYYIDFGK